MQKIGPVQNVRCPKKGCEGKGGDDDDEVKIESARVWRCVFCFRVSYLVSIMAEIILSLAFANNL